MGDHTGGDRTAADIAFLGGVVYRFDGGGPAAALALKDQLVQQVGTDEQIRALIGPHTRVVDLSDRAVLPGINESHLHATWLGLIWPHTLMGSGALTPGEPGPGLRTSGERRSAILRATRLAASMGITSITEPGLGPGEDDGATGAFGSDVLQQYRELAAPGELPVRVTTLALFGELDGASSWPDFANGLAHPVASEHDPRRLHRAGRQIIAVGLPPMGPAYTDRPYLNASRPQLLVRPTGTSDREQVLRQMVLTAHRSGRQVAVHATGDRTIEIVLAAVAEARAETDTDLRHYIVHG